VLSLRSTVVALVASGAAVLVLTGVTAGVFSTPAVDPLVPQANPVDQRATAQQPNLVPPPVPAQPPVPAPQAGPAPQAVVARPPAVVQQPISSAVPVVRQQPVARPAVVLTPVRPQPLPAPAPVAEPAPDHRQGPPAPPGPVSFSPHQKSRTVNTEPCACEGRMRRVPTHWDPPRD
jgi:hypothetical protein